jgi:DNA-binding transcriptional ArsR family regulator
MKQAPAGSSTFDLRRLRGLYRALGDATRLRIVALLAEGGPLPVHEVSARVGLSQPLISWHLRIMRLAGLVETERHGRTSLCRLRRAAFEELREAEAQLLAGTASVGLESSPQGVEVADVG